MANIEQNNILWDTFDPWKWKAVFTLFEKKTFEHEVKGTDTYSPSLGGSTERKYIYF